MPRRFGADDAESPSLFVAVAGLVDAGPLIFFYFQLLFIAGVFALIIYSECAI